MTVTAHMHMLFSVVSNVNIFSDVE